MSYLKTIFILPVFFIFLLISPNFSYSVSDSHLPYWHYNDAKWWSEGKLSDENFLDSLIIILDESETLEICIEKSYLPISIASLKKKGIKTKKFKIYNSKSSLCKDIIICQKLNTQLFKDIK